MAAAASAAAAPAARLPNILVVGTPGTGKTTTCGRIAELTGLQHVEVGALIRDQKLYDDWNAEFDVSEFDEDKVCDALETRLEQGGAIVDFHSCDFMPERWFQLVIVLRTNNEVLWPRLKARQYADKKITENIDAEIAQVCLDEAQSSWPKEMVVELRSDSAQELEENAQRTVTWLKNYKQQHGVPSA